MIQSLKILRITFLDDVPFDFGEVSMMYGWFLIYRMLLCPGTMGSLVRALDSIDPFSQIGQRDIEIAEESTARLKQDYAENFENVALVKTLASVASKVTSAMSSGKLDNLKLSDLSPEKVLEQIKRPIFPRSYELCNSSVWYCGKSCF